MIKIKESNKKIIREIENIMARKFYQELRKISDQIRDDIRKYTINLWKSTETYDSLLNGQLNHEFGFPKGTAKNAVDTILDMVSSSISVVPKLPRRKHGEFKALSIYVFAKSIRQEIFSTPEAVVDTGKEAGTSFANDFAAFGATAIRKTLPWLHWLLLDGNNYLVFGYEYVDIAAPNSRSGRGLMIPSDSEDWKVPAKYSGTRNSNWLTRTLQENSDVIEKEYARIIKQHLGV
jgi:hypothetical protein